MILAPQIFRTVPGESLATWIFIYMMARLAFNHWVFSVQGPKRNLWF